MHVMKTICTARLACAILLVATLLACSKGSVPEEIFSGWKSDHHLYENCYMIVERDLLTIMDADRRLNEYRVRSIKGEDKGRETEVTIRTINKLGVEIAFNIVFVSDSAQKRLYLKNQPDVLWYPVSREELTEETVKNDG